MSKLLKVGAVGFFISLAMAGCGQKDPARPETGALAVLSTPPGATILLDGENAGAMTPDTLTDIEVGVHTVVVSLAGFSSEPESAVVDVKADMVTTATFTLSEIVARGSIAVHSIPQGATIILDEQNTGLLTPDTLEDLTAEEHEVVVTKDGFAPETLAVDVEEAQIHTVIFHLLADRVALAELFTTTWCTNCPEAEAGINQVYTDLGPSKLAVLEYHGQADPFENPATQARRTWYGVTSYPNIFFDGWDKIGGASGDMSDEYRSRVDAHLEAPSPLSLDITSYSVAGTEVEISVEMAITETLPGNDLTAQFVVFEDSVYHDKKGEYYRFVVREASQEALSIHDPGDRTEISKSFAIDDSWNQTRLGVVVFVEYADPKEVIQAITTSSLP